MLQGELSACHIDIPFIINEENVCDSRTATGEFAERMLDLN